MNCAYCLHTGYLPNARGEPQECPACRPKPVAHPDPRGAMEAAVAALEAFHE